MEEFYRDRGQTVAAVERVPGIRAPWAVTP